MTRKENAQKMLEKVESLPSFAREWGASPMASPEERAAFEFVKKRPLVESGKISVRELPEAYGGRPQGSSRRAIRMQQAWDAGYAAELDRQEQLRQIEEFNKAMRIRDLEIQTKQMDLQSKKEEALFEKQTQAEQSSQFLGFQQFANKLVEQKLNPFDSYAAVTDYLSDNPQLANNPLVQKSVYYFEQNAAAEKQRIDNSSAKAVNSVVSAALQAGMTEGDIAKFKVLDNQGRETYNVGGLQRATDILIGERAVAAEERKEPEDKRTDLQKAQDQLANAQARLGAYMEDGEPFDETSESFRKAQADVNEAQARVDRLSGAEKPKPKTQSNLPQNGEVRNGFRYTGPSNDKKAASNRDNWVRE
jgi:hypothetical protein